MIDLFRYSHAVDYDTIIFGAFLGQSAITFKDPSAACRVVETSAQILKRLSVLAESSAPCSFSHQLAGFDHLERKATMQFSCKFSLPASYVATEQDDFCHRYTLSNSRPSPRHFGLAREA